MKAKNTRPTETSRADAPARVRLPTAAVRGVPRVKLEAQVEKVITNLVRILLLLGFDGRTIEREAERAVRRERIPKLRTLVGRGDLDFEGRLLSRWANDVQYLTKLGRPCDLRVRGPAPSFAALVRNELPGESVSKCLTDLVRSGALMRLRNGRVRWCSLFLLRAHQGYALVEDSLRPISALLETAHHNLMCSATGRGQRLLERGVAGFEISAGDVVELCALTRRHGMGLLETLDGWLAQRSGRRAKKQVKSRAVRPYVGLFVSVGKRTKTKS